MDNIIPTDIDKKFMNLALDLASAAIGQTSPNPSVGAIVAKNGILLGSGAHVLPGSEHAEIHALNMAYGKTQGATLYVTLEPCNHYGKTPPCVDAIIKSGIATVFIATLDKNPQMSGASVEALRQNGINVHVGLLQERALEINKMFFHYIMNKAPYITIKAGISMDGKIATHTNHSKWITNELSRADAHKYRSVHDAILVGVNTVIHDNPRLTAHMLDGHKKSITRVILDSTLRTPEDSYVVQDNSAKTIFVTGSKVDKHKSLDYASRDHVSIINLESECIDIQEVIKLLASNFNITSLLVEGGNKIYTAFLQQKLFNEIVLYMAPLLLGGSLAYHFFGGIGFNTVQDAINLQFTQVVTLGDNIKIVAIQG